MLPETGGGQWAKWVKEVKRYIFPVIRQISSGGVMYSTVTIINNIVYLKVGGGGLSEIRSRGRNF